MNKKTLVIIYYDLNIGGIQRKIVDIVNYLAVKKNKVNVNILLRNNDQTFNLKKQIVNSNVKIKYYQTKFKIRAPFSFLIFLLNELIKTESPTILSFSEIPSICAILIKKILFWKKITVVISQDNSFSLERENENKVIAYFRFLLIQKLFPYADSILTVNKSFAQLLIKKYDIDKSLIKYVPNWTSFSKKQKINTKKDFDLVYIGRFAKVKNLNFILKCIKIIKKKYNKITLLLVGDGPEKQKLIALVNKYKINNNVIFVDPTYNVISYLKKSKMFVLASKSEGLPISVLESMAIGTPVIISDYPGVNHEIRNFKTGVIYKNQKEFIENSEKLLENHIFRKNIINNARKHVKKYHTVENIKIYLKATRLI